MRRTGHTSHHRDACASPCRRALRDENRRRTVSRLLVTLLAALTIIAMPLSGGVAAKTTDIYQLARQSVTVTPDGLFAIKGGLSPADSARLHGVFDHLNAEL